MNDEFQPCVLNLSQPVHMVTDSLVPSAILSMPSMRTVHMVTGLVPSAILSVTPWKTSPHGKSSSLWPKTFLNALCENSPHGYWQEKYHSPLSAFNETSPGKVPVSCPQLLPTRSVCMITDFSSILCRILCRLLTRPGNKSTKFPLLFPKHFSVPHGKARQYTCKLRITLIVRNKVTWIYLWTSKIKTYVYFTLFLGICVPDTSYELVVYHSNHSSMKCHKLEFLIS